VINSHDRNFDRDHSMTETAPLAAAHQAIGAYFCAFSLVEQQLGEAVKIVSGLQSHEAGDAFVAALRDVSRKADFVWAASKTAKNADGSDASSEWKARIENTIKDVFICSEQERNRLAHSLLQPNADGSVDLVYRKIGGGEVKGGDAVTWSSDNFNTKIQRLGKLAEELKSLNDELRTFKYTIPNLGWMASSNFEPTMSTLRMGMPDVLREFGGQPLPPMPPDTPKK
jgi:hypothetical protein